MCIGVCVCIIMGFKLSADHAHTKVAVAEDVIYYEECQLEVPNCACVCPLLQVILTNCTQLSADTVVRWTKAAALREL